MLLQHNITTFVTTAASRTAKAWSLRQYTLGEFYDRLAQFHVDEETQDEYLALPLAQQSELKDVGGFVAGTFSGTKRQAQDITSRTMLALDIDNAPAGFATDLYWRLDALGCGFAMYSTRKHRPDVPRLRVIVPLSQPIHPDVYEPLARYVAWRIDPSMQVFDHTTFQAVRMMFWPSASRDGEQIFWYKDAPLLDGNQCVLAAYAGDEAGWTNHARWPKCPGEDVRPTLGKRAQDPEEKHGPVGVFCRTYNIHDAIATFLPDKYTPAGEGRYTFTGGSVGGGAVTYDDKWLYSHHATDPASCQLVNAFDLVRLHLFSDTDPGGGTGGVTKLPSYKAMVELVQQDPQCRQQLVETQRAAANERLMRDFGVSVDACANTGQQAAPAAPVSAQSSRAQAEAAAAAMGLTLPPESAQAPALAGAKAPGVMPVLLPDPDWWAKMDRRPTDNTLLATIGNFIRILTNDPLLAGRFASNELAGKPEITCPVPWDQNVGVRQWLWDVDMPNLKTYCEAYYQLNSHNALSDAVHAVLAQNRYDPLVQYLEGLQWDGVRRLDTMLVDYLGSPNTEYVRQATRRTMMGAVARALQPGIKFDTMLIVNGRQGIGKSTMWSVLGGQWFTDTLTTFEGQKAYEAIDGRWIVEVGELSAMTKSETNSCKAFLSKSTDSYRKAYAKDVMSYKRRCIMVGTSNASSYLTDNTGERRYWPVDTGVLACTKSVFSELARERDQLWAEAVHYWKHGCPAIGEAEGDVEAGGARREGAVDRALYLPAEAVEELAAMHEAYKDENPLVGQIEQWAQQKIPADWYSWPLTQRLAFWAGTATVPEDGLVERKTLCAIEVWCELMQRGKGAYNTREGRELNKALERAVQKLPDAKSWVRYNGRGHGESYGRQRGFYIPV